MPIKKGKPIYSKGDVVYSPSFTGEKELVVENSSFNGFVWMYSFENEQSRIGEFYLVRNLPPKSLKELMIQSINNLKYNDGFSPTLLRWQNTSFRGKQVAEVEYWKLEDKELLAFYDLVLIQAYKPY